MTTDQDKVDSDVEKPSASSANEKTASAGQQELHKPPILLFLLPLVIIIAYAYFTR